MKATIEKLPAVLQETDDFGRTLLHWAARYSSIELCRVLIEMDVSLVKTPCIEGWLPIHESSYCANLKTTQLLFQLFPESLNVPNCFGQCPLHILIQSHLERHGELNNVKQLTLFLLKHDKGAVSKPDEDGNLPLHYLAGMVWTWILLFEIQFFNSYPEAIFVENNQEMTPQEAIDFEAFVLFQRYFEKMASFQSI